MDNEHKYICPNCGMTFYESSMESSICCPRCLEDIEE